MSDTGAAEGGCSEAHRVPGESVTGPAQGVADPLLGLVAGWGVPLLEMTGISKDFDGVKALRGAQLSVAAGEVHALLGENGAGKSTLIKILGGALERDGGTIRLGGAELDLHKPSDATAMGIRVIHQHLTVIGHMSVRENLTLGTERVRFGFIDRQESKLRAARALGQLGVTLDLDRRVGDLRIAEKQLVEIARALALDVRLLVMDEPTASLGNREAGVLFDVIRGLRDRGVAVIYISHRLEEVMRLADRITVLRDGQTVATVSAAGIRRDQLVELMVGRPASHSQRRTVEPGRIILEADDVSTGSGLKDISFVLHAGETLGLYGLLGSGRTELARALCGADRLTSGEIRVDGKRVDLRSPRDGRRAGVGLIPEDRTAQALFMQSSVRENLTSASEDIIASMGWIRSSTERRLATATVDELQIRTPSIEQRVGLLSGGNQQKVVVGRWLIRKPLILVLDDPTVGVDIGAKDEIYRLIGDMTSAGTGVMLISSDLPELLALADRIAVLHEGRLAGILPNRAHIQEEILHLATGGT